MKTITPRKTEVTVKRPDGKIETIIHPKVDFSLLNLIDLNNFHLLFGC